MDPLSTLCVSHLTRLLEMSNLENLKLLGDSCYVSQNLELEENDYINQQTQHNLYKQNIKKIFDFTSTKELPLVFGHPISAITVELIIELIEHLKLKRSTDGLFRISGNKKRQEELKAILNRGGKIKLRSENCQYSAHDISGILKQFFGDLHEPLLTIQLYDCYRQLADMDSVYEKHHKIKTLQYLFLLLPPLNRLLLKKLLELLSIVAKDETNRMTAYNLGVVFAPNIVCTRQPMNCLSDFTDNVEPFTDLVSFIIENSFELFQIPAEFLSEVKQYLQKKDKEKDAEVPMEKTFCQQVDPKQFRKNAKSNTDDALMLLYAHMMDLPDGEKKREFMEKFKESYPGTPLFIPLSVQNRRKEYMNSTDNMSPATPLYSSKTTVIPSKSFPMNGNSTEECLNLLTVTPVSKDIPSQASSTPSTPGARMKLCLKRLRRRSAEIFKPKAPKIPTPEKPEPHLPVLLRMKEAFKRKVPSANKVLKKSVSTPIISRKKQSLSETDLTPNNDRIKNGESALFSEGRVFNRTLEELQPPDGGPIRFQFGKQNEEAVTFSSNHVVNDQSKSLERTPLIRKSLYPDLKNKVDNFTDRFGSKIKPQRDICHTVLKPPFSLKPPIIDSDFDCCDILNGLTLEDNKFSINEASYAKFKERRSYRKLAGLTNDEVGELRNCELNNDSMVS
ncbi:rho GTPase-activating protein 19 isoform X1 [Hydra vulgaris]|nr:rho GTPase-activating protein 19-like isoform X1 [Hydra vulgaris]XP_047129275.1 rho GTPase-activating protein 19-like isoform X1 [Hydra vulgaris]